MNAAEYVLGEADAELHRLRRQQATWAAQTRDWIAQLRLEPGQTVVDAGCGPGYVVPLLREAVGETGRVIAVDASRRYLQELEQQVTSERWRNVEIVHAKLEELDWRASVDAVFARWVLTFPADPAAIVDRIAAWLKPGGRANLIDYNHEGISVYPHSTGFRRVVEAMRQWVADRGGDAFVAGRIPRMLADAGLELRGLTPLVRCGSPGSEIWKWAEEFFLHHSETMAAQGLLTASERNEFVEQWRALCEDACATFYSPIVVCATARKPI